MLKQSIARKSMIEYLQKSKSYHPHWEATLFLEVEKKHQHQDVKQQYMVSNPPTKDSLLVWSLLTRRGLHIIPIIARRLFVSARVHLMLRDYFLKCDIGYLLESELDSDPSNDLLDLNAYITRIKHHFCPEIKEEMWSKKKNKANLLSFIQKYLFYDILTTTVMILTVVAMMRIGDFTFWSV